MIERLPSPDAVLAFKGVGKIEKADYETVLEPAIKAMAAVRGEVRLVYVLGDEFHGYTPGGGWQDAKLGFASYLKWERIAVVTNHDWVRHGVSMFSWVWPGQVKLFDLDQLDRAISWAAGE